MIKIVAIKTAIARQSYTSKTIVSVFQLIYVVVTLILIGGLEKPPVQLFKTCAIVLFLIFIFRLVLLRFPKNCGSCQKPVDKNNAVACSACGNYNVYDLKLWSKREFDDVVVARRTEISRIIQNVMALMIVLWLFSTPVWYFFRVIDKDIRQLNQQRQVVFVEIRPLFLRYKAEHGDFPQSLEQLVPDYMDEVPEVLINAENESSKILKIDYQSSKNTAKFVFNVTHVPNLGASYDIEKGIYDYDSTLAQLLF